MIDNLKNREQQLEEALLGLITLNKTLLESCEKLEDLMYGDEETQQLSLADQNAIADDFSRQVRDMRATLPVVEKVVNGTVTKTVLKENL